MAKLKKELAEMPNNEAADLTWFFGPGSVKFERSTCGSMLEAMERDSCESKKCSQCKGQGILGIGMDVTETGYGDYCSRCNGTGSLPVASKRSKNVLTARPKSQSGGGYGKTPNDKTLTRYASISRRINRLQETDPESVQVLAAFYGNAGTRWAQTEGYSRVFPVLVLTQAGRTILKRSWTSATLQMYDSIPDVPQDAHEQLGQLHLVNKVQPDGARSKLFAEAFLQGERLLNTATENWLGTIKK